MTLCVKYRLIPGHLFLRGQVVRFHNIGLYEAHSLILRRVGVESWWWE